MTLEHPTTVSDEGLLITNPRGFIGLLGTVVRIRGEVARAVERGATMSELAATLSDQDRAATVTAREPDGTSWMISLGAAEVTEAAEATRS